MILPNNCGHPVKRYTARSKPLQDQQARPYPLLPSLQDVALAMAERVGAARLPNSPAFMVCSPMTGESVNKLF